MSGTTRNMRDGTIIIRDGSPTPKTLTIKIDEGNFNFSVKTPSFVVMNRGRIDSRKTGDETPTDINFGVKVEQWSFDYVDTGISINDALRGIGGALAAGWVSTDECGPFSVDIEFRMKNPCNPAQYEQLIFRDFHAEQVSFAENAEANTLQVQGNALVAEPERVFVD
jgi:hypothetical protein